MGTVSCDLCRKKYIKEDMISLLREKFRVSSYEKFFARGDAFDLNLCEDCVEHLLNNTVGVNYTNKIIKKGVTYSYGR
jgi:hypothetical protein